MTKKALDNNKFEVKLVQEKDDDVTTYDQLKNPLNRKDDDWDHFGDTKSYSQERSKKSRNLAGQNNGEESWKKVHVIYKNDSYKWLTIL